MKRVVLGFAIAVACINSGWATAADYAFFGRSGDGIRLDFGSLPGTPEGASFSGLTLDSSDHTVLTSSDLGQGTFSTDGQLWVFPSPFLSAANGDADPDARGFQGDINGRLLVNGVEQTFRVRVQPGHTGVGVGSVGQSFESVNNSGNNLLHVAQQQHRLRYLGFVREGGSPIVVDGLFGPNTDSALRTFQGAFDGGVNTTQANVDGVVGPVTAGWLNAVNAPTWDELIDPDPQTPGQFSLNAMIGDFDILPSTDPDTGQRTGRTPQVERFGTSWAIDLFTAGAALGKAETGRTYLMNGMSTDDGYGSSAYHSTHRVGMDIDVHIDSSAWDFGNGVLDSEEQIAASMAIAMIEAGLEGGDNRGAVERIIASNGDIRDAVNAIYPGVVIADSSGGHQNHMHIDVGVPTQIAGLANLTGDLNLDGRVDAADYTVFRDGLGKTYTAEVYNSVEANYGAGASATPATVPEPGSGTLLLVAGAVASLGVRRAQ